MQSPLLLYVITLLFTIVAFQSNRSTIKKHIEPENVWLFTPSITTFNSFLQ